MVDFTLQDCMVYASVQPCWSCVNACGGCDWSSRLRPIPGWDARKIVKPDAKSPTGLWETYEIRSCPQFVQEVEHP